MSTTTRDLKTVLADLTKIQTEYKGKPMPEDVGTQFETLAAEAKAIQDEADREKQLKSFERFAREVPDAILPPSRDDKPEAKAAGGAAGYITPGELFVYSAIYRDYMAKGAPVENTATVEADVLVKGRDGSLYVPLSADERKNVDTMIREVKAQSARERKAVPTLNTGVIDPQRLDFVAAATMPDELRLRDVLNVSQTNSSSVEYLYETSYTRAAAPVADSASKPEATAAYEVKSATVRTHAVWIPVTEQMLQDAPQIINLVNTRLLWDLDKVLEEEIVYGSGSGQHFMGITNTSGVAAARTVSDDTDLDKIRRGITDVRKAGFQPNAVAMDPIDWEGIVLLKGTSGHYVWAVVTDENGARVWGLRVVETIAAEEVSANTTEERNIIVGDWIRGATLWERTRAAIAMGWINAQFTQNLRTIRAERRAAFAVTAPKAFRTITTQAGVA